MKTTKHNLVKLLAIPILLVSGIGFSKDIKEWVLNYEYVALMRNGELIWQSEYMTPDTPAPRTPALSEQLKAEAAQTREKADIYANRFNQQYEAVKYTAHFSTEE